MENVKQQPCYPRIKRILMGFQDSARHSLSGPPDAVTDASPAAQQPSVDPVKAEVPSDSGDSASRYRRADDASNGRGDVETAAATQDRGGRVPAAGFKRPVLPAPVLTAADRNSRTLELSEARVEGELISCFDVGGEARLCLPQLISRVLPNVAASTLHAVTTALHVYFAECSAGQLAALKRARVLPDAVSRSGLVTLSDAVRICAALLHDSPPPSSCPRRRRPTPADDDVAAAVPVVHECFGGCRGLFWPRDYDSPGSRCVECADCRGRLSPRQFIAHSHTGGESRTCHWGFDCQNWRSYLMLSDEVAAAPDDQMTLQKLLDDMKMLFVGKEDHHELMQVITWNIYTYVTVQWVGHREVPVVVVLVSHGQV